MEGDREASSWVEQYTTNKERLSALGLDLTSGGKGEIAQLQQKVIEVDGYLRRPEVQADDYAKGQAEDQLRSLKADLQIAKLTRQELEQSQRTLDANYKDRFEEHRNTVAQRLSDRTATVNREARVQAHAERFQAEWTPALAQAIQLHKIPQSLAAKFEERSKHAVIFTIDSSGGQPIQNLPQFLAEQARTFMEDVITFHREQSADYARLAVDRAGQPAPVTPAGGAPPVAAETQPQHVSLTDIYKRTRDRLHAVRGGP